MWIGLLCSVVVTAWCGFGLAAAPPPVETQASVLVSPSPLATQAGEAALAAGGNAVDAAVAVSFAIGVVEPWGSGIGGGAFMVTHLGGQTMTWDMREMAPTAATHDMFVRDGKVVRGESIFSARAAGVPGLVRGLVAVHKRHGKLPLAVVMAPAISLARDGIRVTPRMHGAIEQMKEHMNPEARAIYLTQAGEVPKAGTWIVQAALGRTMVGIAETGGEDFYTGAVAAELVRSVRAQGGLWTKEDLANYKVVERPPVVGTYRGHTVLSMGPPSSGGLLLVQMLEVLSGFDLQKMGFGGSDYVHTLAEVMKRAFAMRASGLGDPDHHTVDHAAFIGAPAVEAIREAVAKATKATDAKTLGRVKVKAGESTHTSHFGVMMANGDAVACTQTINLRFGTGRVAGSTGVLLNNEMDDFSALPGVPNAFGLIGDAANAIAAGKRPLSSMTPTILLRDGRAVGVFGSPGGSRIITTTLQQVLNVVDHGMNASEATAAARVHHQWYPDVVRYEPFGLSADTVQALEAKGHILEERGTMGNGGVLWRRADGTLTGGADPRGEGGAGGL